MCDDQLDMFDDVYTVAQKHCSENDGPCEFCKYQAFILLYSFIGYIQC